LTTSIQNIWVTRNLIFHLAIMDLKLRYKGTFLGFLWSVLEPLAQLVVLYVIFSSLRPSNESFIIYLFSGLIVIHLFARGTTQGMLSLNLKKSIILSLNTPKIIFPLSSVMTNILMFGIEIILFFTFIFALNIPLTSTVFFLPIILLLLIILTTGISILLSIIKLYFKDFQTVWSIITMSLIFITPVFWHVKDMPEDITNILLLNPLAVLIEMIHEVVLFDTIPSSNELGYAIATCVGILLISYLLFLKVEGKIPERL